MIDIELTPPAAIQVEVGSLTEVMEAALAAKANTGHTHAISTVTGLQATLDSKNILIDAAMTAHLVEEDPHPQYVSETALAAHAIGTGPGGHLPGNGLTNDDIAEGAAIEWAKISKVGANPADVGAATSSHTHAEFLYEGSSPPSSPTVGKRWLDTGDRMVWFWSGTYWLSEQVFNLNSATTVTVTTNLTPLMPKPVSYNVFLKSFRVGLIYAANNHSGTDYISISVRRYSSTRVATAIGSVLNSQSATSMNAVWQSQTIDQHLDLTALDVLALGFQAVVTGTPGSTGVFANLAYHLAKT